MLFLYKISIYFTLIRYVFFCYTVTISFIMRLLMGKKILANPISIKVNGNKPQDLSSIPFDAKDLGRFGFKNPGEMQAFLKTDTGKIAQSIIGEVIQAELMKKQQQQLDYQSLLHRLRHRIAALLIGLAYKNKAHARLVQAATDRIEIVKKNNNHSTQTTAKKEQQASIKAYEKSLDAMHEAMTIIDKEAIAVEDTLFVLAKDQERMEYGHNLFDKSLDELLNIHEDELQKIIHTTPDILRSIMDEIQTHIEENQDDKAMELRAKHNALVAKNAAAQEVLCFKRQTSEFRFYDADGNAVQTNNNQQAQPHFAIPAKMNLILVRTQNNELALLSPDLVNNGKIAANTPPDAINAGKKAFATLEPEILAVHASIAKKKQAECQRFDERCKPVVARVEELQKMIITIGDKSHAIQTELSKLKSLQTSPRPQPDAKAPMSAMQSSPTQSYRHLLRLMQLNPTKEQVHRFEDTITRDCDNNLSPAEKKELQSIKPGQTIMPSQMARIMELLANTGTSVTQQQQEVRSAPTPMQTVPSPLKTR